MKDSMMDSSPAAPVVIALVVAVAENGVIGRRGALPWRLPSDLKAFRRRTLGHPLIMGRRTFCSLPKTLDGRDSIVITGDPGFAADLAARGAHAAPDLQAALALARRFAAERKVDEIMVLGGASVYAAALPLASRLYLTRVRAAPEGDVTFPALDPAQWREVRCEEPPRGPDDEYSFSAIVLERIGGACPS